jgi:hypothetical protein
MLSFYQLLGQIEQSKHTFQSIFYALHESNNKNSQTLILVDPDLRGFEIPIAKVFYFLAWASKFLVFSIRVGHFGQNEISK